MCSSLCTMTHCEACVPCHPHCTSLEDGIPSWGYVIPSFWEVVLTFKPFQDGLTEGGQDTFINNSWWKAPLSWNSFETPFKIVLKLKHHLSLNLENAWIIPPEAVKPNYLGAPFPCSHLPLAVEVAVKKFCLHGACSERYLLAFSTVLSGTLLESSCICSTVTSRLSRFVA